MDVNSITTIVSTVGFPITCVIALGFFIYKSYEKLTDRNKEREEKLYEMIAENQTQMKALGDTNASFIGVLQSIKDELSNLRNDVDDLKEKEGSK